MFIFWGTSSTPRVAFFPQALKCNNKAEKSEYTKQIIKRKKRGVARARHSDALNSSGTASPPAWFSPKIDTECYRWPSE